MRKKERQLSADAAVSIAEKGEYGILSTVSPDNEPYGVPLNYCYVNQSIYFHCAVEGQKLDYISCNPKVSFCIVGETEVQPEKFTAKFESCIVFGTAAEVFGEEKRMALESLIGKYAGKFQAEGLEYIRSRGEKTRVMKIVPDILSGKANK